MSADPSAASEAAASAPRCGEGGARDDTVAISCQHVTKRFGSQTVLDDLSLDVRHGERLVMLGGSGAGKSTLLDLMAAQSEATQGVIRVHGRDICSMSEAQRAEYRKSTGMLFQNGALFQSMTLGQNVALPLQQHTDLDRDTIETIVKVKLELVGLRPHADKLPSEISGGMRKRAGLARAIALDPTIIFYDEPSAGLDPVSVTEVDELMIGLNETLNVTTIIITHEMTSAFRVAQRMVLLDQGRFVADGSPDELRESDNPLVHQFLNGETHGPLTQRRDDDGYKKDLLRG